MSDTGYHTEYDWNQRQWKRLRYNYTIEQWEFFDYYDGPPPTGVADPRRDSHQQASHSTTPTPTTGSTQPFIPYAGPSNYVQQPLLYAEPTPYPIRSPPSVQTQPAISYATHAQTASSQAAYSQPPYAQHGGPRGKWHGVEGTYNNLDPVPDSHYERLDPSFYVRKADFFQEGRLFAILFTEAAGANALQGVNAVTDYNTALSSAFSQVIYGEMVHTQVRRFIVVQRKQGYCYAVPIFTYNNQGTKKHGVAAQQHAIAYSYGYQPESLPGEETLSKGPICLIMNNPKKPLATASRIFFGIHHPIQYNVKVKDMGYVHPDWMVAFRGYFYMENNVSQQSPSVTNEAAQTGGDGRDGKRRYR